MGFQLKKREKILPDTTAIGKILVQGVIKDD